MVAAVHMKHEEAIAHLRENQFDVRRPLGILREKYAESSDMSKTKNFFSPSLISLANALIKYNFACMSCGEPTSKISICRYDVSQLICAAW